MGFLENDGDLILDAVLTDAGRERLAKGDGSFQVAKFTFGDDEINYGLYQRNHPSGSAYFDLEILQTPVFEPITDNGSTLKSTLITIPRNDLLYLPVLKLNEFGGSSRRTSGLMTNTYIVAVDEDTEENFENTNGIIFGSTTANPNVYIQVDQGLDTTEISPNRQLDDSLIETRYIVEIDSRFGDILAMDGSTRAVPSYIDDDYIASYNFALNSDTAFVDMLPNTSQGQTIRGPKGSRLRFAIRSSLELNSSLYFFNQLGNSGSINDKNGSPITVNYIDTNIRVKGVLTGRTIEVPVRYVKE